MENKKSIVSVFIIIVLVQLVSPVSAVTVTVLDNAYLQGNGYTIIDNTGVTAANFTGSSTVSLNAGKSYTINIKPHGLFDIANESPTDYSGLSVFGGFLKQYIAGLIVIFMLLLMLGSRGKS